MNGQVPLDGGAGMSASEAGNPLLNRGKLLQRQLKDGLGEPELKASCLI